MIKGVRIGGVGKTLTFLDTLVIPIIENTPDEEDLTDSMAQVRFLFQLPLASTTPVPFLPFSSSSKLKHGLLHACWCWFWFWFWVEQAMIDYPAAPAILVRRHGVYVWGSFFFFLFLSSLFLVPSLLVR